MRKMPNKMKISKNVTLTFNNLENVMLFQDRTHRNFSQTLNIIIEQWEKFRVIIEKLEAQEHLDKMQKAEVIKNEA